MDDTEAVAIIGIGLRLPQGIDDENAFWTALLEKRNTHSSVPADRFSTTGWAEACGSGGHFLTQDLEAWDARFFGMLPHEASATDPLQRIMLEVAYEAIEQSGVPLSKLRTSATGCWVGAGSSDWRAMHSIDLEGSLGVGECAASNAFLSGRLSWFFDLHGPSISIDTACSSGLVALDAACQSLRSGAVTMALVGGVNIFMSPMTYTLLQRERLLAPDGRCKPFSAQANGYGRGEAAVVMLLKPWRDAVRDGDPVRAVIRATASNADGFTVGATLPNADAQYSLLQRVYPSPEDAKNVIYVEAHGTGTAAGDPIECEALDRAARSWQRCDKLRIGSVKGNTGHAESVAGLVALLKAVLSAEKRLIPPTVVAGGRLTTAVDWSRNLLEVVQEAHPLPQDRPIRIGVCSYGASGTNAHAVVEPAPVVSEQCTKAVCSRRPRLFSITAADRDTLAQQQSRLHDYVTRRNPRDEAALLRDLAYTLTVRRTAFRWRRTFVAQDRRELLDALSTVEPTCEGDAARSPQLAFVFTGQGAQWPGMGTALLQYDAFSQSIDAADAFLRTALQCEWSARQELSRSETESRVHLAQYSQTLCTILQVALVDLLTACNVRPVAVVGHSSGEIAAAYCGGAITREHAWTLAYQRGQACASLLTGGTRPGGMLAASMDPAAAAAWVAERLPGGAASVACENSPSSVTFSGEAAAMDALHDQCLQAGIWSRRLKVPLPYHTRYMSAAAAEYLDAILDSADTGAARETWQSSCVMVSTVSGESVTGDDDLGPAYWARNLVMPVLFKQGLQTMIRDHLTRESPAIIVEVGPSNALHNPIMDTLAHMQREDITYCSALDRKQHDCRPFLNTIGHLFGQGTSVRFDNLQVLSDEQPHPRVLTDLPAYAWNRRALSSPLGRPARDYLHRSAATQGLLGPRVLGTCPSSYVWRSFISLERHQWLSHHTINDTVVFPGAALISMVVQAGRQIVAPGREILTDSFRDVRIHKATLVPNDEPLELIVSMTPQQRSWTSFELWAGSPAKQPHLACTGEWRFTCVPDPESHLARELDLTNSAVLQDYAEHERRCTLSCSHQTFYDNVGKIGYGYGPAFRRLRDIRTGSNRFCAHVLWDATTCSTEADMLLDPVLLDAAFQASLGAGHDVLEDVLAPQSISSIELSLPSLGGRSCGLQMWGNTHAIGPRKYAAEISVVNVAAGKEVIRVTGLTTAPVQAGHRRTRFDRQLCSRLTWGPDLSLTKLRLGRDAVRESQDQTVAIELRAAAFMHHLSHSIARPKVLLLGPKGSVLSSLLRFPPDGMARAVEVSRIDSIEQDSLKVIDHGYDIVSICCANLTSQETQWLREVIRTVGDKSVFCLWGPRPQVDSVRNVLDGDGLECLLSEELGHASHPEMIAAFRSWTPPPKIHSTPPVVIVVGDDSGMITADFAKHIQTSLKALDIEASTETLTPSLQLRGAWVISLLELEESFLGCMTEVRLQSLKSLLASSTMLLWITAISGPLRALVQGFGRTIRHEYSRTLEFRTLHLASSTAEEGPRQAELVVELIRARPRDLEHVEDPSGVLCCPRFSPDRRLNSYLRKPEAPLYHTDHFKHSNPYTFLRCIQPGDADSLVLQEPLTCSTIDLAHDEVEVRVAASGVNFKDALVEAGVLDRTQLGGEAAGIIERVGDSVRDFHVGDAVFLFAFGAHARTVRGNSLLCRHVPSGVNLTEAASIPVNHCTAYYALMIACPLSANGMTTSGQRILIHNASGGVGQVAIQIAQHLHMEIFATVGTGPKRDMLMREYNIPSDHILHSRDASFAMAVKRLTRGAGVDVIINTAIGELAEETWSCLGPFGTFIELSKNTQLRLNPDRDSRLVAFDLENMIEAKDSNLGRALDGALDFLRRGITRIVTSVTTHHAADACVAMKAMQSPVHTGKQVLTWDADEVVRFVRAPGLLPTLCLDGNATYMLVGGLGGIGRSIARLLARHGARHLSFVSRSGVRAGSAGERLVRELEQQGLHVDAHAVDIGDHDALRGVFAGYEQHGPPIRGVIQCAMALHDTLFGGMNVDQWKQSLWPKVQGTWNLHMLMPRDLDFFVILSSFIALIGNVGQSNYGAACAYQDSLAEVRREQGLKATSINLGIMGEVGIVAEGKVSESAGLRGWENATLSENDLHALLAVVVDDQMRDCGALDAALPTGIPWSKNAVGNTGYLSDAKFDELEPDDAGVTHAADVGDGVLDPNSASFASRIAATQSGHEASAVILEALIDRCVQRVGVAREEIRPDMSLVEYGYDSLSVGELHTWMSRHLKVRLNIFDLLNSSSLSELARCAAQSIGFDVSI